MASDHASRMRAIVGTVVPGLRNAGFRKRRHAFNRSASASVTHVLDFRMGRADAGSDLAGAFTINLGVHSTGLCLPHDQPGAWINEYDCQLRRRFGELLPYWRKDIWLRLDGVDPELPGALSDELWEHGLPWLDDFPTDEAILDRYLALGQDAIGMLPRAPLEIAALQIALRDRVAALETAREYLSRDLGLHHRPYAEEVIRNLGLGAAL